MTSRLASWWRGAPAAAPADPAPPAEAALPDPGLPAPPPPPPALPARPAPPSAGGMVIRRGDRVAIFGRTGSGKSVMLRHLLGAYSRAVLADPKGRAHMPGWPIVYGSSAFAKAWPGTPRIVARPGPGEDRRAWIDALAWHIYRHGETALGLDEVIGLLSDSRGSAGFDAILTQGRELGITALVCSQRPRRIPLTIRSEADHVIAFGLSVEDDRRAVAEVIGPYANPPDRSFRYVYWRGDLTTPIESRPLPLRA